MVSMININKVSKELTCRYPNCDISHMLVFGEYVKMRESLYTQVISYWTNTMNLHHINIKSILTRYYES